MPYSYVITTFIRTTLITGFVLTTLDAYRTSKPCVFPEQPQHGTYRINSVPDGQEHGYSSDILYVNVSCHPGYKIKGSDVIFCFYGIWSVETLPTCSRACKIQKQEILEYHCLLPEDQGFDGTRLCNDFEVEGTVVLPRCRKPWYFSPNEPLPYMFCQDGEWNYQPLCLPECGTVHTKEEALMLGGQIARYNELPWHISLYRTRGWKFTCGGSIVGEYLAVTAAHCVTDKKGQKLPAKTFAVAAGKLTRPWINTSEDLYVQKSYVSEIHIPLQYRGDAENYQHDLAVLVLTTRLKFNAHVHPVCLDLQKQFNDQTLSPGNLGKIGGYELTSARGLSEAPTLRVLELPVVARDDCMRHTLYDEFLLGDKFCAGYVVPNGLALCKGDSGGGLAFPVEILGLTRYYLEGVASTKPPVIGCVESSMTSFTAVSEHAAFISKHLMAAG